MIRITGGEFKGRVSQYRKGQAYRPTQAKVRQAIFNVLGERVKGAKVLDLFCGSGALGIEALSRGARHVTFVDQDRGCAKLVQANLTRLGCMDRAEVISQDALQAIRRFAKVDVGIGPFDIALLDPPYHQGLAMKTLKALAAYGRLNLQSFVVVEHHRLDLLPERVERFELRRRYRYGDTMVSFFA